MKREGAEFFSCPSRPGRGGKPQRARWVSSLRPPKKANRRQRVDLVRPAEYRTFVIVMSNGGRGADAPRPFSSPAHPPD